MQTIPAWLSDLFTVIDYKDAKDLGQFLSDDVEFCFANAAPVAGREAVIASIDDFFTRLKALSHTIEDVIEDDDRIICRGQVTYTRVDGSTINVSFSNWFYLKGELISRYLIFVDNSALFD